VAVDDHPWLMKIEPMRRELADSLAEVEARLTASE
jgi:hypothetical protein